MKTARWMPVPRPPGLDGSAGMNNDAKKEGRETPKIPALKFVDWYLSQLPR